MIRINQLTLSIDADEKELKKEILTKLKIGEKQLVDYEIIKKSIDARKETVKYVYTVDVKINNEEKILKKIKDRNVNSVKPVIYMHKASGNIHINDRPVIVGSGPAGLFCGYMLAKNGYAPIIVERGDKVENRVNIVQKFWTENKLDTNCNVQFGEGGAGTFSDGKLNTLVKDSLGRGKKVLEIFTQFGAPSEIMYLNKPHIGTDKLVEVVKNMRNEIIKLGGEVLFNSTVDDVIIENNQVKAVKVGERVINTNIVVFAIGHSARDTFYMLQRKNVIMTQKAFAIGLRIEHPKEMIDKAMYAEMYKKLPSADYKLTHQASNQRGVYSFCMCPGGFVVNASSENERLAVNGMSNYKRDARNSNSALIVTVTPEDFESNNVLAGVEFQRKWENAAYKEGKKNVPVSLYSDFRLNRTSTGVGKIVPNIKGSYTLANLNNVLPKYVCESIKEGVDAFDRKIKGFADDEAVLSGVETRTSSPVRIVRNEEFESNIKGLYPCGEGAGYAGGITSAAIDGIKVYEAITNKYIME